MAKKATGVTIEMLEKRINWGDSAAIRNAVAKYFDLPLDDPNRPSKEVALWFIKRIDADAAFLHGGISYILEIGYFTYEEMLELGVGNILARYINHTRFGLEDMENHPFPKDIDKFKKLLDRELSDHREIIAKGLLTQNIRMIDSKTPKLKKAYMKFLDKAFGMLVQMSGMSEGEAWRRASYIPSSTIARKFTQSVGSPVALHEARGMFERRCGNKAVPYEQIVDGLMPFFSTFPMSSRQYPYCKGVSTEAILYALDDAVADLASDKEGRRSKVYNYFIKPLMSNVSLLSNIHGSSLISYSLKQYVARIGGAVVPAGELVNFTQSVLFKLEKVGSNRRCLVEDMARIKIQNKLPVSREFIELQQKLNSYEGRICYNNKCINDFQFWLDDRDRRDSNTIFPSGVSFNTSFEETFKLKVEDLELFRAHKEHINWNALNTIKEIPKEYLMEFSWFFQLHCLSKEVFATLDEEVLTEYLNLGGHVPPSFFLVNKNISVEYLVKNIDRLLDNRRSISNCKHISLSEMVAALA